jgi:hypothetical protein
MPSFAAICTTERLLLRTLLLLLLGARLMLLRSRRWRRLHCAGGYFRLLLRLELSASLVLRFNSFKILD